MLPSWTVVLPETVYSVGTYEETTEKAPDPVCERLQNPVNPVYTLLMHLIAVQKPRIRASGRKKVQHTSTKTLNSGVARVFYDARYLDPKTSRWISADPAMGEYIPQAPINDEAKKSNKNLPGMGGVFNYVNFHVYHYAGNNPVKYIDPNGMWIDNGDGTHTAEKGDTLWGLYGADWQSKSGYKGDPKQLQVGEKVGYREIRPSTSARIDTSAHSRTRDSVTTGISESPTQSSDTKIITFGLGAKGAIIFGIGLEGGLAIDTDGGVGVYGTFSVGTGVQIGLTGKNGIINFAKALLGPSAGWADGSVQSGTNKSTTVDSGILVMGTYDLNNLNANGSPNSISFGAVGGGIWRNYTGTIKIR